MGSRPAPRAGGATRPSRAPPARRIRRHRHEPPSPSEPALALPALGSSLPREVRVEQDVAPCRAVTPRRLTYDTPEGRKEVKTRAVALTVPAYVAADLVAEKSAAAAEALKVRPAALRRRLPACTLRQRRGHAERCSGRGAKAPAAACARLRDRAVLQGAWTHAMHPPAASARPSSPRRAWTTRPSAPSPWPTPSRRSARTA